MPTKITCDTESFYDWETDTGKLVMSITKLVSLFGKRFLKSKVA